MQQLFATPMALRALGVAALAGLVGWGLLAVRNAGREACETEHQARLAEHLQRGIEQAQVIARQDAEVSEYFERWRTEQQTKIITVVEEVTREIPADCRTCALTPAGLRKLNDALRGMPATPADPEQPDSRVPAPANPGRWQLPGGGRAPGDVWPSLRIMRDPAQPAGASAAGA